MEIVKIALQFLEPNTGQVPGLPPNPRQWTKAEVQNIAKSLKDTPELFEARPLLVFPITGGKFVILGGNLRHEGAKRNKMKEVPCIVFPEDTPPAKLKEIVIKDNGAFGSWDYDELANQWDDLPLPEWGVPAWDPGASSDMGLTTQGREGAEGYDEFVNKFDKELPLTTDDCYTPPEVYDIVRDFVSEHITPLKGRKIVRPFFPGGDYEDLTQYPPGCIVLDNPPFSIFSKIVRYYCTNRVPFFLFGPQLSLLVQGADVCYLPLSAVVVYENGAKVNTGFVTNMLPGIRIKCVPGMNAAIAAAQKTEPTTPVYEYPDEVVSSALLGKIGSNAELEILSKESAYVHNLDGLKEIDKGLFGGGLLLSRAAAEKARAAAEKARAVKIDLSPRELEIVENLSKNG